MRVLVISGKAGHGKDTVAGFLKDGLEADGNSVLVVHYADLLKYVCKSFFGWNGEKDKAGRSLLQHVGTDVIRARDENFWVRFVAEILLFFSDAWDFVLIPDCRFPNEIEFLKEMGFDVTHLRVVRENFHSALTAEQQEHPSETALDAIEANYTILNDGTMDDLMRSVSELLTALNGYHQLSFGEINTTIGG